MESEKLDFKSVEEWHSDSGNLWSGYMIYLEPIEIDIPACIECEIPFVAGQKVFRVKQRGVEGSAEGHSSYAENIGYICKACLGKAKEKGVFRDGQYMRIETLKKKEYALIQNCPHDIKDNGAGGAQCVVCGTSFGWYCPTAPSKHCEYKDDPDSCIYCGQPQERK